MLELSEAPEWILDAEDGFSYRVLDALADADFSNNELTVLLDAVAGVELLLFAAGEYTAMEYLVSALEAITATAEIDNAKFVDFVFYLMVSLDDVVAAGVAAGYLTNEERQAFNAIANGGPEMIGNMIIESLAPIMVLLELELADIIEEFGILFGDIYQMLQNMPEFGNEPQSAEELGEMIRFATGAVSSYFDLMYLEARLISLVAELFGMYEVADRSNQIIEDIIAIRGPIEAALAVVESDEAIEALFVAINDEYSDAGLIVLGHALYALLHHEDTPSRPILEELVYELIDSLGLSHDATTVVSDIFAFAGYANSLAFDGYLTEDAISEELRAFLSDIWSLVAGDVVIVERHGIGGAPEDCCDDPAHFSYPAIQMPYGEVA